MLRFELVRELDAPLTAAEQAIAQAVVDGASNLAIAQERGRSVNTVANQVAALYRKLGVRSRQELAFALARRSNEAAGEKAGRVADGRLRWFARAVLEAASDGDGSHAFDALAAGHWRVIDHFDTDRRRYVVARRAPEPLSPVERLLVQRRARGDSVKELAIDLGLSSATVSRRLAAALHKLGLQAHSELPRLFAVARAA